MSGAFNQQMLVLLIKHELCDNIVDLLAIQSSLKVLFYHQRANLGVDLFLNDERHTISKLPPNLGGLLLSLLCNQAHQHVALRS